MGKYGNKDAHRNGKQGENAEVLAYTETTKRIMEMAVNGEEKRYKNPMQLAIAVSGYEEWSRKTGIEPSYAALAYYLNISKEQLLRYSEDATKYVCYCLAGQGGEIIYAGNSENEVKKYAQGHYFQKQDNNIRDCRK